MGDARSMALIPDQSVHLVVTSPPYWTLKRYHETYGQMGHIADYELFLKELSKVWAEVYRVLVPGGRLVCVVGDVCLFAKRARPSSRDASSCRYCCQLQENRL